MTGCLECVAVGLKRLVSQRSSEALCVRVIILLTLRGGVAVALYTFLRGPGLPRCIGPKGQSMG